MDEIYAIAEIGEFRDDLRSLFSSDAGEEQERSGCQHKAIDGAETPAYLKGHGVNVYLAP